MCTILRLKYNELLLDDYLYQTILIIPDMVTFDFRTLNGNVRALYGLTMRIAIRRCLYLCSERDVRWLGLG